MNHFKATFSSLLGALTVLSCTTASAAWDFQLNLSEGMEWKKETLISVSNSGQSSSPVDLEETQAAQFTTTLNSTSTVLSSGEHYVIGERTDRVRSHFSGPAFPPVTMDSDDGFTPTGNPAELPMLFVGHELQYHITPKGTCLQVEGFEAIIEKSFSEQAENKAFVESMTAALKEQQEQNQGMSEFSFFPSAPVEQGESWTVELPFGPSRAFGEEKATQIELELVSLENGLAHLQGAGSETITFNYEDIPGMEGASCNIPVEITLDLIVDEATGLTLQTEVISNMNMTIEQLDKDPLYNQMIIKISSRTSLTP